MSPNPEQDLELEDDAPPAWPAAEFELTLRKTLTVGDQTYSSVLLREPTGTEWEEIFSKPAALRRRFAISLIGGVPMAVTAKMGIGDLVVGEAYLNSFFDVGSAIGARSSWS